MTKSARRRRNSSIFLTKRRERHRLRTVRHERVGERRVSWARKDSKQTYRTVWAPSRFTIERIVNRLAVLRFLKDVRESVLVRSEHVFINFSRTTKMVSDGTLLLKAELDRINRLTHPRRMMSCSYPSDRIVEQVLQHTGIFGCLGKTGRFAIKHPTVRNWCTATGIRVEGKQREDAYWRLSQNMIGRVASPLTSRLFGGLNEAITNCSQHAYEEDRGDGIPSLYRETRWWMFSQELDGFLTVAICDLGIGIRRSLKREKKATWARVVDIAKNIGSGKKDADMIQVAIELSKTSTGQSNRGKGLHDLKKVAELSKSGWLTIYSGHGYYKYTGGLNIETTLEYNDSILGTMIIWNIPLD